jgi:hypothetical protein
MPNITEAGLCAYLEHFHALYRDVAMRRLPADLRSHLERFSLLSRGCVGYVSTQFGAGFEYVEEPGLRTVRGSTRVEDLIYAAPAALRKLDPAFRVSDGGDTTIGRFTLDGRRPLTLLGENTHALLIDLRIRGGGWSRYIEWAELYGNRTAEFWSLEMASRRALEELLVATIDAQQVQARDTDLTTYLQTYRQRHVLLLGSFAGGRETLLTIKAELDHLGYVPVLASDIPDIAEHSLQQKILTLLLACRFVIIEDSIPAGQLTELPEADFANSVTLVLRQTGAQSSWMTRGVSIASTVIREMTYDVDTLPTVVEEAVQWAENQVQTLGKAYDDLYPWRKPK